MIIFMISTKHSVEMVEVCKKNYVCDKPMVVVDYNRRKCAANLSNQMIPILHHIEEPSRGI